MKCHQAVITEYTAVFMARRDQYVGFIEHGTYLHKLYICASIVISIQGQEMK